MVNLSSADAIVLYGVWQNPLPVSLVHDSYKLGPGEARNCDINASNLSIDLFDKTGRAQIRALVRCSARSVCGTLEVFDSKTGRTSISISL
ncbi:MAG: hypothetical protein ABIO44_07655 [Saprospiraceae bacterium]